MAKSKNRKKSNSGKMQFNQNLYEKSRPKEDEYSSSNKFAYIIYCICAVFFGISTIIYYSQQNMTKGLFYLICLVISVYLIHRYHQKTGK